MSMRYPGGFIASTPVTAAYPSGVWTQAQAIPYQAQNVWTRDQYWPYTTLLLQGNGTNGAQNNTFLDSSSNNFTITRNGNTTQGSFTPYEANGYWSNYFDGNGDYLVFPSMSGFGTGDFTIEAWVYPAVAGTSKMIVDTRTPDILGPYAFSITNSDKLDFLYSGSSPFRLTSTTSIAANTWTHVAVSRASGTLRLFINGVQDGSVSTSASITGNAVMWIGAGRADGSGNPGYYFNGYISNFRTLNGTGLYTTTFTPPAAPLTAITNTQVLTCQSNRFIDNSTNAFAITRNGDVSVQAFQPFPGATTYSGTVLGGSGYFDGNGDYFTVPGNAAFQFDTGDFTIEAWVYFSTVGNTRLINRRLANGGASGTWSWNVASDGMGFTEVIVGEPGPSASYSSIVGRWAHIAVSRQSGTARLFLDGVQIASQSFTNNLNNSSYSVFIAADAGGGGLFFPGYLSGLRVVKGTAVYTANFTPPAAPLTAITNTSLLLNFTNAGIFDAAVMNDLETVGNAQVSTSVVKYGTGSMAFDGNGDILSSPASQNYVFGGDLTIEGWVYINSSMASSRPDNLKIFIFAGWNTGNTPQFYVVGTTSTPGTGLGYYDGTNDYQVAVTIPKDQWVHIAYVRSGSVISGFVNGVRYTITSSYSSTIGSANTFVIGGNPNQVSGYYSYLNGYIDDLRITKGVARYITSFTPPPARMPGQ